MKVLVTGCAGFIGSHITERLLKDGAAVIGVDNFINGSRENISKLKRNLTSKQKENFSFFETDITHFGNLKALIDNKLAWKTGKLTHICHQAAVGSVPRSIKTPSVTMKHNVQGFINVLEIAKIFQVQQLVYASSSSVYGDNQSDLKQEVYTGAPLSPYALSKSIDEQLAEMWAKTYEMNIIGLRYFNVFGPRQRPDGPYAAVIPKWIEAIKEDEPIEIFGDGEQGRDFTYVKNVVEANLLALDSYFTGHQVYNIACGYRTTLNELVEMLQLVMHKKAVVKYLPERQGDIKNSLADISKARLDLGYKPEYTIVQGLQEWLQDAKVYTQKDAVG